MSVASEASGPTHSSQPTRSVASIALKVAQNNEILHKKSERVEQPVKWRAVLYDWFSVAIIFVAYMLRMNEANHRTRSVALAALRHT